MVVIHVAHTTRINPPGSEPILSPAQAWAGLLWKARFPQDFVPVVESCEIHSETDDAVECTVTFKASADVAHPRTIREVCHLGAPCRLDYEMEGGSKATNVISTGTDPSGQEELLLTFIFAWNHPEFTLESREAKEAESSYKSVASVVVGTSIETMRKMAREGKL